MEAYQKAAKWLGQAKKIAVVTGAGISTESGIPDFRSSNGLYHQETALHYPLEEVLSRDFFNEQPELFYRFYRKHLLHPAAEPNPGHFFLKYLDDLGAEVTVITQNIDGLHQRAGSSRIIELHGNASRARNQRGEQFKLNEIHMSEASWSVDGEWVRPDIVLYGEMLDLPAIEASIQAVSAADVLLVMGTSLTVYPAAGLLFDYGGTQSILVNKEPTRLDRCFDLSFHTSITRWTIEISKWLDSLREERI